MVVLFAAKPVEGWCSVAIGPALNLLDIAIRSLNQPKKPKEETPKEEKKEEPKSEPEKKRSGGYVKAADGCAQRGKTKGRIV
jgi:hypothetical protein